VFRRTGHRELAEGEKLSSATMFDANRDATLVRLEARLVNVHETIAGEVLELETGATNYLARASNGSHAAELPPNGSLIEITGVYAAQGRALDPERGVGIFEILLNSMSDVRVLERAPWWTPRRTVAALAILGVILLLAAIWIAMLRKRVEEKTSALKEEIDGHKRTEEQLEKKTRLLENEVEERKAIECEMQRIHELLMQASRDAGMAEVATGVLHNAGNVLNGANLSLTFLIDRVKALPSTRLEKIVALLRAHAHEMEQFLSKDPKGRMIPEFLEKLLEQNIGERAALLAECESLRKSLDHLNQVVAMQQDYASQIFGLEESTRIEDLVEDALKITAADFLRRRVSVERDFASVCPIRADKHRVLQVLVNLLKNAAEACSEVNESGGKIRVRIAAAEAEQVVVEIEDNGVGISAQNMTRIFGQGFTTRREGRGFGLHSSALIAHDIGGKLTANSDGPGKGARFTFFLPLTTRATASQRVPVEIES
jgi:C4-dicarboxylate-specific signal transduction histidine kinase